MSPGAGNGPIPAAGIADSEIGIDPPGDCNHCPRLVEYRAVNRAGHPDWHNRPVPSFGGLDARLLIVGLAPGLAGANRTGRPFTGDFAGGLLYTTLVKFGFAKGAYGARANDGLELIGARITNAVRCVPPKNRPEAREVNACRGYLASEIAAMAGLEAILALGTLAHNAVVSALGLKRPAWPFGHGALHELPGGLVLADSYHCSRYNTNTRRLTPEMFEEVFRTLRRRIA